MSLLGRHLVRAGLTGGRAILRRPSVVPPITAATATRSLYYYQTPEEDLARHPKQHTVAFGEYKTETEKLENGVWPWNLGLRSRLPDFYKERLLEFYTRKQIAVHYIEDTRKWTVDQYGVRKPVQNIPIPVIYPNACDEGLWGGEGLVQGLRKKQDKPLKTTTPRVWKPNLVRRVFHSEILDQYLEITVTMRLLDLVDEAQGFDNYILMTHEVDMRSKLGMRLKQAMLLALARKSMHPEDPAKCEAVYEKYKQHVMSEQEAEWVGLTLNEAEQKQMMMEEGTRLSKLRPMKELFAEELVQKLKEDKLSDDDSAASGGGWVSKLNPFKDEKSVD